MKQFYFKLNLWFASILIIFMFSGCEVFDKINNYLLEITQIGSTADNREDTTTTPTCNDGYVYDSSTNSCIYDCADGYMYDYTNNICVPDGSNGTCADGYVYDSGSCIPEDDYCNTGYEYDSSTKQCILECDDGEMYDYKDKICVLDGSNGTCSDGYIYNSSKKQCIPEDDYCADGYIYTNETCVRDGSDGTCVRDGSDGTCGDGYVYDSGSCTPEDDYCEGNETYNSITKVCESDSVDISEYMFELTFVDTDYSKYHELNLSFYETSTLELTTSPAQSGVPLTIYSDNPTLFDAVDSNESDGTYGLSITAGQISGNSEFNISVDNGNYIDSVSLSFNVDTPISFSSIRSEYILYVDEEVNVTVNVTDVLGNGLNIYVQDLDMHNTNDSNISIVTSESQYLSGTENGIDFQLQITGKELTSNHPITIVAQDVVNKQTDYFTIYAVVVEQDPNFITDLQSCGSTTIDLSKYQIIQDVNSAVSVGGTDDTHFKVTSLYEVATGLNDNYTNIMVYYPTLPNYSLDRRSYYFYANSVNIATFLYSKTLSQEEIYVKYYDDILHEIVCKTTKLPIVVE